MTKKNRRLFLAFGIFAFAASAVALTLSALKSSITYFYMPSEIAAMAERPGGAIRLGGLVETGSINYPNAAASTGKNSLVEFRVTDGANAVKVVYAGLLPDLFREGQGVIVQGRFASDGALLKADNVLAKHDENYMPKEVADALKEQGLWQKEEKGE
ncbi:MAG: cytochrome c biogenesis protein CcmE [Alphaproteobacteria bacterium RIFCSPHIGHO2_12_FULL_63_12]|nr:MAG: cytochrome c biogenesis protein CcmE [Alphaproteobacteria bacterium RIFCSPHIGHO2_12_FULL_63_12]